MGAAACDNHFLMERSVVGLLRLAIRLMRREDMSPVVSCVTFSVLSEFKHETRLGRNLINCLSVR
jgi:hypothetical protein